VLQARTRGFSDYALAMGIYLRDILYRLLAVAIVVCIVGGTLLFHRWQNPVIDIWEETATVLDYTSKTRKIYGGRSFGRLGRRKELGQETQYYAEIRDETDVVVKIFYGKSKPRIGSRITIEWVEFEDGTMWARRPQYDPADDPLSLQNI